MAANLIKIDTTSCNADYTIFLSTPQGLGRYLTVKDSGKNAQYFVSNSIVISTTSGYTFYGGSSREYIRNTNSFLSFTAMHSNWRLLNTVPYTALGHALISNISTTNLFVSGTFSTIGQLIVHSNMVVSGVTDVQTIPTLKGVPLVIVGNLVSTVSGLGSLGYTSSFSSSITSFISTVENLGTYGFISSTQLQSTVAALGTIGYISQASVLSTFQGLGLTYFSTPSLVSTVQGLGTFGYISSKSLISTVKGLEGITYISTTQYTSSLAGLSNINTSNTISTMNGLGLIGYISSTQLQSTIAGLGTSGYISVSQIPSTVSGISYQNTCNLISTVLNLGQYYISTGHVISTISGISNVNSSNILSTINGIGYISSLSLQSTVAGLGTSQYISTTQLTSTVAGINSNLSNILSTINRLGTLQYISVSHLVSTVIGFSNLNTSNMISGTNSLATLGYISSLSLQSTLAGLGRLNYISIGDLISTTRWYNSNSGSSSEDPMPSTIAALGNIGYISTASLTSTFSGIQTIISNLPYEDGNNFTTTMSNTINNLGTLGLCYFSTANLTSTVAGLGTFRYLSTGFLVSTINGYTSVPTGVGSLLYNDLGNNYASRTQLISSTSSTRTMPIFNLDSFQVTNVYTASNIENITELSSSNLIYVDSNNYMYNVNTNTNSSTPLLNTSLNNIGFSFAINPITSKLYYFNSNSLNEYNINTSTESPITTGSTGYQDGTNTSTVAFNTPRGIALDSLYSNLYVCDYGNGYLRKVQLNPTSVSSVCILSNSYLITLDSRSTFAYILTGSNAAHSIYKVSLLTYKPTPVLQTTLTTFIQQYQNGGTYIFQCMTLDPSNTFLYLTLGKTAGNSILKYNLITNTGLLLGTSNGGNISGPLVPASNQYTAKFSNPFGIIYSKYNNCLYVADNGNSAIRQIIIPLYTSTITGLNAYRNVKTISLFNSNIISAQTNYFVCSSNGQLTTSSFYLSNSQIYCTSNVYVSTTVTAATFTATNGRSSGTPSWGFYYGDGTHVTSISDSRLKENIVPLSNALQIVRGLQAVYYTKDDKRWIGYIAQDVEEVLPIIVSTDDSPNEWKSIQYTNLPGLLIEAVKELRVKYSRIEALLSNASRPS